MLSLTVNTSSSLGSMVLGSGSTVLGEIEWNKDKSHSEKITVMLEELLTKSGKTLKDLEIVICGYGPGSFTGLRVGLSVVKTLAYSLGIPIMAVDDCMALALNALSLCPPEPICAIIDAQKNKVFAAVYEVTNGKLVTVLRPSLLDFEELHQCLKAEKYLCVGDGYNAYSTFFPTELSKKLIRAKTELDVQKARAIFEYVSKNSSDFPKLKWSELSALYLRASAAEEVLADKLSKNR